MGAFSEVSYLCIRLGIFWFQRRWSSESNDSRTKVRTRHAASVCVTHLYCGTRRLWSKHLLLPLTYLLNIQCQTSLWIWSFTQNIFMLNLTEIQFEEMRWAPILKFLPTIWFLQMRWAPLQTIANTNTDICRKIAWRYIIRNCPMFLHSGLLHNAPHSECNTKYIIRSCSGSAANYLCLKSITGEGEILFCCYSISVIIAFKMVHISDLGVHSQDHHMRPSRFLSLWGGWI